MILRRLITIISLTFLLNSVCVGSDALNTYHAVTRLDGDWTLSPADVQEGSATEKGPAAEVMATGNTAISFKVVGKGSVVQENLLPATGKEMVTMYHCDTFKNCSQVHAKHYCAKQNQPELILDAAKSSDRVVVMTCDMETSLCNSAEDHVHMIKHELSADNSHLKTTYTIFKDGKFEKDSIYHFDRK